MEGNKFFVSELHQFKYRQSKQAIFIASRIVDAFIFLWFCSKHQSKKLLQGESDIERGVFCKRFKK